MRGNVSDNYRCPEIVRCHGPRHTNLTMAKREHFCRICERDWTCTRGVEGIEEVDEESYSPQPIVSVSGDEEAHPGG